MLVILYLVPLETIYVNLPSKILIKMLGILSTLLTSLMRNNFPERPSGALLYTLSKLYDFPIGFVTTPLI